MPDEAQELLTRLQQWLTGSALPLWWESGADHRLGGFHEKLDQDGQPVVLPKRARVQPRQIYCYGQALLLGWRGPARQAVQHGVDFYLAHYLRPDGLFRTLVAPDGAPLDDRALFYDQAFALLGLNTAYRALDREPRFRDHAHQLLRQWSAIRRHPRLGFAEPLPGQPPLGANPHMHLLESALAWAADDADGPWRALADEIGELALSHLIDAETGALHEFFDGDWRRLSAGEGGLIEPGHQFEWAWLLMRWGVLANRPEAMTAAARLIEVGEQGVDPARGVACNSLSEDLRRQDGRARLWPQTERLKAHCLAASLLGTDRHWPLAVAAAEGLLRYLDTARPGLWFDLLGEDDRFVQEPAPASSFYHIVGAIAELQRCVNGP